VARRKRHLDALAQRGFQLRRQFVAGAHDDEQRHVGFAAEEFEVDHQAVEDLRQFLDRAIQFAGAHADAVAVDGGVRAAVDDRAAARRDAQPVAVAPDAGVHVEVALAVAAVFRVVPEHERHRGHGRAADQFADFVDQRLARVVEGLDPGAEAAALHLAQIHRQRRHAADEAAGEVGAAGDRVEPDVAADVVVNPLVALGRQRRAGGADRAQRDRSATWFGSTRALRQERKKAAPAPKKLTRVSPTKRHRAFQSGQPGLPS
jgi:hypothetical protein